MHFPKIIVATLLGCSMCIAYAQTQSPQKQPSPEDMQKVMDATMGAMVPMMGRMTEVMIEAQLKIAEKPETAQRLATFKRNLFDALVKKGFTQDQAMQITLTTALPSAAPSGK